MSLKPADLAAADYKTALKPQLGFEQQLLVSTQQYTELGTIEVVAPNSGTYTANVADNVQLALVPQELAVVLNTADIDLGAPLTVTVNGLDSNSAPVTGVAVFQPPAYAQDQSFGFQRGWAHEATTLGAAGKKWKQILSVSIAYAGSPGTTIPELRIFGLPPLDNSSAGTFRLIGTKVSLDFDPKVPMPTAIKDGQDNGKYIKPGDIDVGKLTISAKIPSGADGLSRVNGRRVTGWVRELKESRLPTQNIILMGLIMTSKQKNPEGQDPATLDADAMYEVIAFILAH